jgi:hypothetical protein
VGKSTTPGGREKHAYFWKENLYGKVVSRGKRVVVNSPVSFDIHERLSPFWRLKGRERVEIESDGFNEAFR